jgi:hypothetical protein
MSPQPPGRLGRYFLLPPRWRWLVWPALALGAGGLAVAFWLHVEVLAVASCLPIAALPVLALLLYWFDLKLFKDAQALPKDLDHDASD